MDAHCLRLSERLTLLSDLQMYGRICCSACTVYNPGVGDSQTATILGCPCRMLYQEENPHRSSPMPHRIPRVKSNLIGLWAGNPGIDRESFCHSTKELALSVVTAGIDDSVWYLFDFLTPFLDRELWIQCPVFLRLYQAHFSRF